MKKILFFLVIILLTFNDSKAQLFDTIFTQVYLNAQPPHTLRAVGSKGCQYISGVSIQALGDAANTQDVRIYFKCQCAALAILGFDTSIALNVAYPFSVRVITIWDSGAVDTSVTDPRCYNPPLPIPTDTIEIPAQKITNIGNRPENQNKVQVYPNPATSFVFIDYPNLIKIKSVEVYGMDGKRYRVQQNSFHQIYIESLLPGLYYLRIHTDQGIFHRKFLKQ